MRDIIKLILEGKNSKEKARLMEKFRDFQYNKENKQQILEIYREAESLLDNGTDQEKIVALRVIGNIYGIFPFPSFGIDDTKAEIKSDEVLDLLDKCVKILKEDNGNLRIASAHAINHLRSHIYDYEYVDLFYDLLSLENSIDKKKAKSIEFCLDKIYCPHLKMAIESFMPNEVKRMKINLHGSVNKKHKKIAEEVENLANRMVEATEKYIPKILALRGKHLFDKNLVPYIENIGMFQVLYELQKLSDIREDNQISNEILQKYIWSRLVICLKANLEKMEKIEDKRDWEGIFIDLKENKLIFLHLDKIFFTFKNIFEKINKDGGQFIDFHSD